MTQAEFYGAGFPYRSLTEYPGRLIVLEGKEQPAGLRRPKPGQQYYLGGAGTQEPDVGCSGRRGCLYCHP